VPKPTPSNLAFATLLAAALILGFLAAYLMRWFCDDIFITLRYAEQYLAGNGFVYNTGERVEGYTHFIWLLIITGMQALGLDPVNASMGLGIAAYLGTILVFGLISYRTARERGTAVFVPMTALALAANYECNVWATSGLETFFFAFLLSLAFYVFFFTRVGGRTRLGISAALLILAGMTRPDGLLIYAVAGLSLAVRVFLRRSAWKSALGDVAVFALPALVIYLPYAVWKTSYYGSFFPNTYYAKSANLSYYSQGFYYLWLYLRAYPSTALVLLGVPAMFLAFRRKERLRPAPLVLAAVAVYLVLFVARVGGDFMYSRFVVPMLPFIYWVIEWSLRGLLRRRRWVCAVILLLIPMMAATGERALRHNLLIERMGSYHSIRNHRGVLDERFYYLFAHPIWLDVELGKLVRQYFEGLDVTVILRGQSCFGYYGGFNRLIENSGLTEPTIARLPLEKRGRVGHEKAPKYEYLIELGVDMSFTPRMYKERDYRRVFFELNERKLGAELLTYDAALMTELRRRMGRAIQFIEFEAYLDRYIEDELVARTTEEVQQDYEEFREFYFAHNNDREREQPFLTRLSGE
jgi:hypothetical protein